MHKVFWEVVWLHDSNAQCFPGNILLFGLWNHCNFTKIINLIFPMIKIISAIQRKSRNPKVVRNRTSNLRSSICCGVRALPSWKKKSFYRNYKPINVTDSRGSRKMQCTRERQQCTPSTALHWCLWGSRIKNGHCTLFYTVRLLRASACFGTIDDIK